MVDQQILVMPPEGNHTGERVAPDVRAKIVQLLAEGRSKRRIASLVRASQHTVKAIEAVETQSIAERKQKLIGSFLRISESGSEKIEQLLHEDKISANLLVPVTGMAIDKVALLSGDPGLIIRHEHDHRHIHVDLANDFDSFLRELPASNHEAKVLPVLEMEETASCAPKEQGNYCYAHQRPATYQNEDGTYKCDPSLGGILAICDTLPTIRP